MRFAALVRADFLDRARRPSFVFALAPAAYLGYTVYAGFWSMRHGEFRAEQSAAYVGTMTALLTGLVLALLGFYLVKNAVARDRRTGVGQILAATPLGKPLYTLGKAASNLLVLSAMVAVLAGAALLVAMTGSGQMSGADLFLPFALLAMPLVAVTASAAVLFECIPLLRAGLGNVVWLLIWAGLPMAAIQGDALWLDPTGLSVVEASLLDAQHEAYPLEAVDLISLNAGPRGRQYRSFAWSGIDWTTTAVASRLWWFPLALLLALGAALPFDRFDPARERHRRRLSKVPGSAAGDAEDDAARPGSGAQDAAGQVDATTRRALGRLRSGTSIRHGHGQIGRLVAAELRLLLGGQPWPWYLGLLGLLVAQIAAPLGVVHRHLLPFVWIWPIVVWSRMGCWSRLQGIEPLLDAAPRPVLRQLPATWMAGALIGLSSMSPAMVRLLLRGDSSWIGPAAAMVFVPSLALALGSWSGTPRLFEVVYLIIWYAGPLSGAAPLDFLGVSLEGEPAVPLTFAVSALPLLAAAAVARSWRLKR